MAKSIVHIDPEQLEEEVFGQAELYLEHAELLANARYELDVLKAAMEVTEIEIKKDIRDNPEKYDIHKVTEDQVKTMYVVQVGYQKAQSKYLKAKHHVELLQVAVNALEQRKRMLEKSVDLQLSGFYADPKIRNKDIREEVAERSKKAIRGKIKIGGKRRKEEDDDD